MVNFPPSIDLRELAVIIRSLIERYVTGLSFSRFSEVEFSGYLKRLSKTWRLKWEGVYTSAAHVHG